jgi:hypothetical protein
VLLVIRRLFRPVLARLAAGGPAARRRLAPLRLFPGGTPLRAALRAVAAYCTRNRPAEPPGPVVDPRLGISEVGAPLFLDARLRGRR